MIAQRGGFVLGLVAGLLIGLAVALGVALYITKAPVPFINKVPQRTAEQDSAETERNRTWDPNAPLGGKPVRPLAAASGAVAAAPPAASAAVTAPVPVPVPGVTPAASAAKPPRDPAAILAGAAAPAPATAPAKAVAEGFVFFVQAGAFTRGEDAEQQRAKLALMGQTAKVTEREQAGRTVFRVRLGPFPTREEADALLARLQEQSIEAQIVRVEKP
jgi:cell division protein FtsN